MNSNNIDISVVIVSYNVKSYLLACIESIYKFTKNNFEIIVIDNNSKDDSVNAIKNNFKEVIVIANNYNAGFPAANNQGFKIAKGEFIFMLNPDTELLEDSLSVLADYLKNHPEVKLAAPKLLNTDHTIQSSVFRFPKIKYIAAQMFYLDNKLGSKFYQDKNKNEIFEIDSALGAALFFRKSLLDEIGMLDENMFWIEDIDFCYRIRNSGGKIIYLPATSLIHHVGKSAKTNYKISVSNQVFNKIKFYKKHKSVISYLIVLIISFLNTLMRLIVFTCLAPFKRTYFLKMKAYAYTFIHIFSLPGGSL